MALGRRALTRCRRMELPRPFIRIGVFSRIPVLACSLRNSPCRYHGCRAPHFTHCCVTVGFWSCAPTVFLASPLGLDHKAPAGRCSTPHRPGTTASKSSVPDALRIVIVDDARSGHTASRLAWGGPGLRRADARPRGRLVVCNFALCEGSGLDVFISVATVMESCEQMARRNERCRDGLMVRKG